LSLEHERDRVRNVLRAKVREVLGELPAERIAAAASLKDLGANSVDRVEIAALAMEDLDLDFPLHELGDVGTIDGLVDELARRLTVTRRGAES
jgi:acyl carrier protein